MTIRRAPAFLTLRSYSIVFTNRRASAFLTSRSSSTMYTQTCPDLYIIFYTYTFTDGIVTIICTFITWAIPVIFYFIKPSVHILLHKILIIAKKDWPEFFI